MAKYKIYPVRLGMQEARDKSGGTYLQNSGIKVPSAIMGFLIVGEGRCIMVDVGCGPAQWSIEKHNFHLTEWYPLPEALESIGFRVKDIDAVVLTHLHHDHCWNLADIPDVPAYVQKDEVMFAMDPLPYQWYYYEVAQVGMTPKWYAEMYRFTYVDGDCEIFEGIKLIKFCGHTAGSQGVLVDTEAGKILIAGDTVNLYDNWEGKGVWKHIPNTIHIDVSDMYKDFEKIESLNCAHILPGHDIRVLDHKVYPVGD